MVKLLICVWLGLSVFGIYNLYEFSNKPGEVGEIHTAWPVASKIATKMKAHHLVMFVHPGCTCSKASLINLNKILELHPELEASVVFLDVPGIKIDQSHPLMKIAALKKQTQIIHDKNGFEANNFSAKTSGITFLYNRKSELLFTGGLTPSRGHEGDSHGMQQVLGHLKGEADQSKLSYIFGCSLFGRKIASSERGDQ